MIQAFVVSRLAGDAQGAIDALGALAATARVTRTGADVTGARTVVAELHVASMEELGRLMAETIQDLGGLVYPLVFAVENVADGRPLPSFVLPATL